MTAREKYDTMLRDEVGPWLRQRGFIKRRGRFRRTDDRGWQVIDFQASQWGSSDDVRFTINLWVGVSELVDAEPDAQVRQRIGRLLSAGEDRWWPVDAGTDMGALGKKLRQVLDEYAMPWLDARSTLEGLMTLARERPDEFPRYALGRFRMLLERADLSALASEVPA